MSNRFIGLSDNGGPTETHELGAGSVAIDGGADICDSSEDQRIFARPDTSDGNNCDRGAFEVQ